MNTLKDHINLDLTNWFVANNLKYKTVNIKKDNGLLIIIFNEDYCIKIYDRLGHGFGVSINIAEKYDESIYNNDSFTLTWAFNYFNIVETASFSSRSESQYLKNLSNLINDLKNIIPRLSKMTQMEWLKMKEWITESANKRFT
jgi:hypothetical protein